MQVFKYYKNRNDELGAESAHMAGMFCAQRMTSRDYVVMPIENLTDTTDFAEVIIGHRPQRIKLDIDSKTQIDISDVCDSAIGVFRQLWPREELPKITLLSSHGLGKYSYHVIFSAYVEDNTHCALFTRVLISSMGVDYIDKSVNSSLQHFRMYLASKPHENRPFIAEEFGEPVVLADTLISAYGKVSTLPRLTGEVKSAPTAAPPFVLEAMQWPYPNHEFAGIASSTAWTQVIRLRRTSPDTTQCRICKGGPHTSDNTGVIYVSAATSSGSPVYHGCRRGGTPILCGYIGKPAEAGAPDWKMLAAVCQERESLPTGFDQLKKVEYQDSSLRDFSTGTDETTRAICVRAATKMGKTKMLKSYVDRFYPTQRVVILSFRRAFSANIREKFPDFTLYSDTRGELFARRLIVQIESLHRLILNEPPDLLIMDECESILAQFSAGLSKNFGIVWAVFRWLVQNSSMLICMDAGLGQRSFDVLSALRRDFASTAVYHHASFANATDTKHYITHSKEVWHGLLEQALLQDKKIAIPVSSLTEATALYKSIKRKYPERSIQVYSSKTQPSELKRHLSDVAKYWAVSVLIYTPTITAGVSFELKHFDIIFGYFLHTSCDAATTHQMMARIRDVGSRRSVVFLDPATSYLPITAIEIERQMLANRADLARSYDVSGLNYTVEAGELRVEKTDYWNLWVANVISANKSRRNLTQEWCQLARETGAEICPIDAAACSDFGSSLRDIFACGETALLSQNATKIEIKIESADLIAAAREITEQEHENIASAKAYEDDISEEQQAEYDKKSLRIHYNYSGVIDREFVLTYASSASRRAYKNLRTFVDSLNAAESIYTDGDLIHQTLAGIQACELNKYLDRKAGDFSKAVEPRFRYYYPIHRNLHACIRACGFSSIMDRECRPAILCAAGIPAIHAALQYLCPEFGMKAIPAGETDIHLLMKPLSSILQQFYSHRIKSLSGEVFQIISCGHFTIEKTNLYVVRLG